jgi:AcrR family transcriptional regulator
MPIVVTRDDYFAAALDILADVGPDGLRINALCTALGVTTGSFYGYFGSLDGFINQLLEHWYSRHTKRIAEIASAPSDPQKRIDLLKQNVIAKPLHEAEAAIRAWARSNKSVAAMQARVDKERHQLLRTFLRSMLRDSRRADTLAMLGMSIEIGMQQWRHPPKSAELRRVLNEFEILLRHHANEAGVPLDSYAY